MLGRFFKRRPFQHAPRLLCAVYDLGDAQVSGPMFRPSELTGLTVALMRIHGHVTGNLAESDLPDLGLSVDAAWSEALASTRELLSQVRVEEVAPSSKLFALTSENSLARHAVMLFWGDRPEWTGRVGSVLAPIDKHMSLASVVDDRADLRPSLSEIVQLARSSAEAPENETAVVELWWRDQSGFEPLVFRDGKLRPGPRLGS
jgi:hypothetical protein